MHPKVENIPQNMPLSNSERMKWDDQRVDWAEDRGVTQELRNDKRRKLPLFVRTRTCKKNMTSQKSKSLVFDITD